MLALTGLITLLSIVKMFHLNFQHSNSVRAICDFVFSMCWVFGCSGSVVNGALEYISTDLGFATDAVKQGTPFLDNMFLISQSLLLSLQNI